MFWWHFIHPGKILVESFSIFVAFVVVVVVVRGETFELSRIFKVLAMHIV